MTILERLDTSISQLPGSSPVARPSDNQTIQSPCACALLEARSSGQCSFCRTSVVGLYALFAFCREVVDIADGDAPRPLKDVLLSDWPSEILHPLR